MTVSDIKICSRKREEAKRPSELEEVLLGYYIKLKPVSKESCVYLGIERLRCGKQINRNFGIKSLLSQNWGACIYTKIWREKRGNSKLPKSCQSRKRLHNGRYQLIQI